MAAITEYTLEQLGRVFDIDGQEFTLAEILEENDPIELEGISFLSLEVGQETGDGYHMATVKRIA